MTPGLAERHPLKEKRRANKPLLERKRRARINDSLSDLKTLVLSSLNKDVSKYTKMEKVDILDMTVQFLKGKCFEKPVEDQMSVYRAGYSECTQQIYRSIMSMDGIDHSHKYKILSKIAERLHPDERLMTPPPSPKSFCPKSSYNSHPVPCVPTTHFEHSPTRQYIDTNPIIPKDCPIGPKDIDNIQSVNKEVRLSPYHSNSEHGKLPNTDYRGPPPQFSRYDLARTEQFDAKLTRHSPLYSKVTDEYSNVTDMYSKVTDVYSKVTDVQSSSSVWRPW